MKLSEVKMGPIRETLDSRQDLDWANEGGGTWSTTFDIKDRRYGITVLEEHHDGMKIAGVNFTINGDVKASDLHTDQFKVLGIVKNGVMERFGDCDGFYFVAKKAADQEHYESRVKLYSRLRFWAAAEHSLIGRGVENANETISYLARNKQVLAVMTGETDAG
jgi:hypothetical protein